MEFIKAEPYNHLVIDNFFEESYLRTVLEEIKGYKQMMDDDYRKNETDFEVQSKKIGLSDYNRMGSVLQQFFDFSKSPEMLSFLEDITGIQDLQADPHLYGGGIHRTSTGGRLSIHADFNIHPITKQHRRINMLIYLNPEWQPRFHGELELWQKDMNRCVKRVEPIFNRVILFRITDDAFHGHPIPWEGPDTIPRLSIALYYYTNDRPEHEKSDPHMAVWYKRYNLEY